MNTVEFGEGKYGTCAILKSEWQESYRDTLLKKDIAELVLNDGKGWKGENIDFLEFFPKLKSLTIIDLKIKAVDSIKHLHNLVSLNLSTYSKRPIDFTSFPKLKDCAFEWIKGSDSFFECKNLESLSINRYNQKNTDNFAKLVNLKQLTILNSPIEDLRFLSSLQKLEYLRLANLKNIISVEGLDSLDKIKDLEINHCKKIQSVSGVFNLKNLTKLALIDTGYIDSIKGIEKLTKLESFVFYESTNVLDGDLSPLFKLKKLSNISFQNRKHYTNMREEFKGYR
jgi:hypothetical protein